MVGDREMGMRSSDESDDDDRRQEREHSEYDFSLLHVNPHKSLTTMTAFCKVLVNFVIVVVAVDALTLQHRPRSR